jgi:hypothetical protein
MGLDLRDSADELEIPDPPPAPPTPPEGVTVEAEEDETGTGAWFEAASAIWTSKSAGSEISRLGPWSNVGVASMELAETKKPPGASGKTEAAAAAAEEEEDECAADPFASPPLVVLAGDVLPSLDPVEAVVSGFAREAR